MPLAATPGRDSRNRPLSSWRTRGPNRSRRPDKLTVNINVCEHPEPVAELRRIYNTISQTLGYRTLMQFSGNDVWQLKVMLHATRHLSSGAGENGSRLDGDGVHGGRDCGSRCVPHGGTSRDGIAHLAAGAVDAETVARLWAALQRAGKADAVRRELLDVVSVRR